MKARRLAVYSLILTLLMGALGSPGGAPAEAESVAVAVKYDGYIQKQLDQVERFRALEHKLLPPDYDFTQIKALSAEAAQKLNRYRPASIGQASRISGVSPADINVLLVWLKK